MLYAKQKTDREIVSVLNDVDFCIELMESDRINVAYIMNLKINDITGCSAAEAVIVIVVQFHTRMPIWMKRTTCHIVFANLQSVKLGCLPNRNRRFYSFKNIQSVLPPTFSFIRSIVRPLYRKKRATLVFTRKPQFTEV